MAKTSTLSSIIGLFLIILSVYCTISYSASVDTVGRRFRRNAEDIVQGLYNVSDDVEELMEHSFNKYVYNSDRAWFVEFYNTWCGHCRKYAPTYKAVAEYFRNYKDILAIAAIDCSNEVNVQTCRNFEIMGYPTLRYFHENYLEEPQNLGKNVFKASDDISTNIQLVIDTIIAEQNEGRAQMIPKLNPYGHIDISKVFEFTKSDVKFAILVIDNDSLLGVQSILTFHKVPNIFITYAMKSNEALIDSLGLPNNIPALVILNSAGIVLKKNFTDMTSLREIITTFLKKEGIDVDKYLHDKREKIVEDNGTKKTEGQENNDKVKKMGDVVFQMDLENALRFSLRQEISRTKVIEGERLKALRNYLKVLVRYFPIGRKGHLFINDLSTLAANSDSLKGMEISSLVKESEKENNLVWSTPKEWLGCKGTTPETRGYPCGVWTMFHFLTVNAAEQNIGRNNANPKEVLNAMYGYIKYFFGCADCSEHFQAMAAERKMDEVSTFDEAIMWLWAAHNVVNARLSGDPTEDPLFPKQQFPTGENCPECRYQNGSWNTNEVEKYLKHIYSSTNIRYIGSDMKVVDGYDESSNYSSNGIFGPVDSRHNWLIMMSLYLCYIYTSH